MPRAEIRPLTGLRGIAACWVALYHIHWQAVAAGAVPALLGHGYLAVDVFFVLSGYVMMITYAGPRTAPWSAGKYIDFMLRRVGRIWPAYLMVTLALAALMALRLLRPIGLSPLPLLANLTLTQAWWKTPIIDAPSWSVSAEMLAYLLFPLIATAALRLKGMAGAGAMVTLLLVVYRLPALQDWLAGRPIHDNGMLDISSSLTRAPLIRCMAEFSLGALLYGMATPGLMRLAARSRVAVPVLMAILVLLNIRNTDLALATLIPALVMICAAQGPAIRLLLSNRVAYTLGCWSYALYLIHFHSNKIQIVAAQHLGGLHRLALPASYLVQYAVLIAGSALIYVSVEKPAQRLFRRLGRRVEAAFLSPALGPELAKGAV